jgi:2-polyprenyl-3-methyl-5-hydroxy-6-metoxy-1,4-benzoquinol methylase
VGAGNSPFSEEMYAEGYKNITNIDFSEIVVEDMQLKYRNAGYADSLKCKFDSMKFSTAMPVI